MFYIYAFSTVLGVSLKSNLFAIIQIFVPLTPASALISFNLPALFSIEAVVTTHL